MLPKECKEKIDSDFQKADKKESRASMLMMLSCKQQRPLSVTDIPVISLMQLHSSPAKYPIYMVQLSLTCKRKKCHISAVNSNHNSGSRSCRHGQGSCNSHGRHGGGRVGHNPHHQGSNIINGVNVSNPTCTFTDEKWMDLSYNQGIDYILAAKECLQLCRPNNNGGMAMGDAAKVGITLEPFINIQTTAMAPHHNKRTIPITLAMASMVARMGVALDVVHMAGNNMFILAANWILTPFSAVILIE
eukprot:3019876-Ditylum_brightwellii.AAC.1